MNTENAFALAGAIAILFLAIIAFPVFMFVMIRRGLSRARKYGGISDGLMGGTITQAFGEVQCWRRTSFVDVKFRVVGVQAESPAVGLELHARGPVFRRLWPIRLDPEQADAVARWLEQAAGGHAGAPPGNGWQLYRASGFAGARVQGLHGTVETTVRTTRWRLHVVSVDNPDAPVGVGIRGRLALLSDRVTGSLLPPSSATALAAHLRQAAAAARSSERRTPPVVA